MNGVHQALVDASPIDPENITLDRNLDALKISDEDWLAIFKDVARMSGNEYGFHDLADMQTVGDLMEYFGE